MSLDVRSDIRNGARYTLRGALLLYTDGESALATFHSPRAGNGGIELGPGEVMDAEAIHRVAADLVAGADCTYLPPRVLAAGAARTVWWCPAAVRTLAFAGEAARHLRDDAGLPAPQPPLVFTATGRELSVHALSIDTRPDPDTPLMRAPYPNLYPGGRVCLGSARTPERHGADTINGWETGFWESAFSHMNPVSDGPVVAETGGVIALWRRLMRTGADTFPTEVLIEDTLTLGDLIAGRGRA